MNVELYNYLKEIAKIYEAKLKISKDESMDGYYLNGVIEISEGYD